MEDAVSNVTRCLTHSVSNFHENHIMLNLFPSYQVCDSLQDCEDGQDEAECGSLPASCAQDEFACSKVLY